MEINIKKRRKIKLRPTYKLQMYIEETLNLAEQFRLAIVLFYLVRPRLCKCTYSVHVYMCVFACVYTCAEEEEKGWVERSWNGRNFGLASPIQQPENYGHLPLW